MSKLMLAFLLLNIIRIECTSIPGITDSAARFQTKQPIKSGIQSYAGFVNATETDRLFFWFFPSENKASDPLIIWIEGDMVSSSVRGLFENNGPVYVKPEKGLNARKHYWSQNYNVLYLDSSIFVGFSHRNSDKKSPINLNSVVNNLHSGIDNFYEVLPRLKTNDLYLSSSGLGCKLITKLALKVDSVKRFNFKGLIIENGLCDPLNSMSLAHHYLNLRLIDKKYYDTMMNIEIQIANLIKSNKLNEAFDMYDTYIKKIITPYPTIFNNLTHFKTSWNLLDSEHGRNYGSYINHVNKNNIKFNINVNKTEFQFTTDAIKQLKSELMRSSSVDLATILNKYKVLMYYGQMNPEISPKSSVAIASSIKWRGGEYFNDVNYLPLVCNGALSGYYIDVRSSDVRGTLTYVLIRNAGKDVADYKPNEILILVNKFVNGKLNE